MSIGPLGEVTHKCTWPHKEGGHKNKFQWMHITNTEAPLLQRLDIEFHQNSVDV
jgi:hypothetical protein